MALVAERPHNKHGSSVFVRDGLKVNSISVGEEDNVEFITVELPDVVVHSVYKPPAKQFLLPQLRNRNMPQHLNWQRRRNGRTMGCIKQPITHTQCEAAEIIQQCYMEEGVQP